jgi:hypothetical protein
MFVSKTGFNSGDILIPYNIDLNKWSVVACDQYTSDREYWKDVKKYVGDEKSVLNIIFPEIYLEDEDRQQRIKNINAYMQEYLDNNIFTQLKNKYIYVERTQNDGHIRCGIMGVVDLEEYDFNIGSQSLIRATEGTVLDRIPPRVAIRENAVIETPHIMLLIDDDDNTVIEPLCMKKDNFKLAYQTDLMKNGGSVKGYVIDEEGAKNIDNALLKMADINNFSKNMIYMIKVYYYSQWVTAIIHWPLQRPAMIILKKHFQRTRLRNLQPFCFGGSCKFA